MTRFFKSILLFACLNLANATNNTKDDEPVWLDKDPTDEIKELHKVGEDHVSKDNHLNQKRTQIRMEPLKEAYYFKKYC